MKVIIRTYSPEYDTGAIMASWPNGAFYSPAQPIGVVKKLWFQQYYAYVKSQLLTSKVLVACLDESPEIIIGFCVIDGHTLEWIGVKWEFRQQGIAKMLIKGHVVTQVNHKNLTKLGRAILNNHPEMDKEKNHG